MKTKLLVTIMLLFVVKIASAQVVIALLFGKELNTDKLEFGITGGPNFSSIKGVPDKAHTGLNLALYFNIKLSDRLFLHPEAAPKSVYGGRDIAPYPTGDAGLDSLYTNGSVTRSIKYMSLPLLCRYRIHKLLFVEAGPQFSLRMNVKDEFETDVNGNSLKYKTSVTKQYTLFDAGVAAGLALKFKSDKSMGVGVRYYYGLVDVMKDQPGHQSNQGLLAYVSIPIGGGSKKTAAPASK